MEKDPNVVTELEVLRQRRAELENRLGELQVRTRKILVFQFSNLSLSLSLSLYQSPLTEHDGMLVEMIMSLTAIFSDIDM